MKLEFRDEGIRASNCSVPLREKGDGSALNNDVAYLILHMWGEVRSDGLKSVCCARSFTLFQSVLTVPM